MTEQEIEEIYSQYIKEQISSVIDKKAKKVSFKFVNSQFIDEYIINELNGSVIDSDVLDDVGTYFVTYEVQDIQYQLCVTYNEITFLSSE